jgi:AMIN domain-containing protein
VLASEAVRTAAPIALVAFAALGAERGRLLSVRAAGDAGTAVVELQGDRPLSFSTLKLASPPRIVIDLADTAVAVLAAEQEVSDGTVRRIAVADAGARTARVVIELAAESEFDVRASAASIEVRVPRVAPLATRPDPIPAPEPAPAGDAPRLDAAVPTPPPAEAYASVQAPAGEIPEVREAPAGEIPEVRERASLPTVALVGSKRPVAAPAAPSGSPLRITGIGFRPLSGGEVLVRSDRPLEYGVSTVDRAVLLHLPRAAIPLANNRRPLDTRYFAGPVERVVPLQVPGGTDVRIELRQPAEVHLEQTGPLLTVSFTPTN